MNVALTFNVKPACLDLAEPRRESETGNNGKQTFTEELSPIPNQTQVQTQKAPVSISSNQNGIDAYAEWDTWETINAVKEAIESFHNVTLLKQMKTLLKL